MNPPDDTIFYVDIVCPLKTIRIEKSNDQLQTQLILNLESFGYSTMGDFSVHSYIDVSTYIRIFNGKMLQDAQVRELLMEYLI